MATWWLFPFQFIRFRGAALRASRLWGWLRSGWRPQGLVVLTGACIAWRSVSWPALWRRPWPALSQLLSSTTMSSVLWAIFAFLFWYALLALLLSGWKARRQIAVEEFIDHANETPKSEAKGLSTLLAVRLVQLIELYRVVDEQSLIPPSTGSDGALTATTQAESKGAIAATIKAENVGQLLQGAISAESKLSLGFLQIPVGALIALVGRIVQGPRIQGSLHRQDGRLILTAQMAGDNRFYSWRVEEPPSTSANAGALADLIEELAHRILTDLALSGSTRWRATWKFSQGLREYRECIQTPRDRVLKLKQAERYFLEALAEDTGFDLAHYNLGVVYTELRQFETAEVALGRAIQQNPGRRENYYALARICHEAKRYAEVLPLCDQYLSFGLTDVEAAKAHDLKGRALRLMAKQAEADQPLSNTLLIAAIKSREKAVARVWRALCAAERGQPAGRMESHRALAPLKTLTANCLINLAVSDAYWAKSNGQQRFFRRATILLRQAGSLVRHDPKIFFETGKIYEAWGKNADAAQAFDTALRMAPALGNVAPLSQATGAWSYLALTRAAAAKGRFAASNQRAARAACEKVLDGASQVLNDAFPVNAEHLQRVSEAYRLLGDQPQAARVAGIPAFLQELKQDAGRGDIFALRRRSARLTGREFVWEQAQIAAAIGRCYKNKGQAARGAAYLKCAIRRLSPHYPEEIRVQGLRVELAFLLKDQGRPVDALREAEQALRLDPLNTYERSQVAALYESLNDWDNARAAWENALTLEPDNPATRVSLGLARQQLNQDSRDLNLRREASQQAIASVEQALRLYEVQGGEGKGWAHWTLGNLNSGLGLYPKAISHLRIARELKFAPLTSTANLAYALLKNKTYEQCEIELKRIVRDIDQKRRDGQSLSAILEAENGYQVPLGVVLISALTSLALCYAERGVNLEEARRCVCQAKNAFLATFPAQSQEAQSPYWTEYRASCLAHQGWIAFHQGHTDRAIQRLDQAAAILASAEVYWFLASALEVKFNSCTDPLERKALPSRIQTSCRLTRELDVMEEYAADLQALLQRVQERLEREAQQEREKPANSAPPQPAAAQPPAAPKHEPSIWARWFQ